MDLSKLLWVLFGYGYIDDMCAEYTQFIVDLSSQ